MGFFNTFMDLLDDKSDTSFEKKMNTALDKIENVLGATVDKAESSLNKVDAAGKVLEKSVQKVEKINSSALDTVDKKLVQG